MDEMVTTLIQLADKRFSLGLFGLGVVLLGFGIWVDPNALPRVSQDELLVIATLGAAFTLLSVWVWWKYNDFEVKRYEVSVEQDKHSKEIKLYEKRIELQSNLVDLEKQKLNKPKLQP